MRLVGTIVLVFCATCTIVSTKTLRGQSPSQSLKCRIALLDTLEQQGDGIMTHDQETMCFPIINERDMPMLHSIALPNDIRQDYKSQIEAGTLIVGVEDGVIEDDQVIISEDSSIVVLHTGNTQPMHRQLGQSHYRTVAIVRVSLSSGVEVDYTADKIHKHLFENENCMAQQLFNCLNGMLHMESAGIYEIIVPGGPSNYASPSQIRNKALEILADTVASPEQLADHVMVILPPCGFNFVANAVTNHWLSTYNNHWSLDMIVYMHEIGHNLGRGHAYLSNGRYDFSSVMSATGPAPNLTGPLKCFNAADNKRLGFYNSRSTVVFPQSDLAEFVTVAAFAEWSKGYKDDPLLVSFGKYSMQYNFATKHNRGTEILRDTLAIAHVDPGTGRTVVHEEGLEPDGTVFTVDNFADTQKTLQVEACRKISGSPTVPSTIIVGFSLGQSMSPCSQLTVSSTATPATTSATTTSKPTSLSTPICRNTSKLDVKFWWGNAYAVRSCENVGQYPSTFCARHETSDPKITRYVFDVCEQECSGWNVCQVSDAAEPVMKPPQPNCPDTSRVEIIVWKHPIGGVRETCAWVAENNGYCRRRELSNDPSRFYVYQFCEQECSEWVWCE